MTLSEQQEQRKLQPYAEALRYMSNAEETLRKTKKEDNHYLDGKYVSTACGTAYKGVLKAMDAWLEAKGVSMPTKRDKTKKHRSIDTYRRDVRFDGRMLSDLNTVYDVLHLAGYYDEITYVPVIRGGFDRAYSIIEKIKPAIPDEELQTYLVEHQKKKSSFWRQLYSFLFF
ncbi:hypothetical protein FACS189452_09960 [Bacteroidia bacterium]|nr:hypothetical protein FACS189452_09960 [Bacteroidia bacterium]